jgi:hypothetical protein
MGTVSDDIRGCELSDKIKKSGRQLSPQQAAAAVMVVLWGSRRRPVPLTWVRGVLGRQA